MIFHKLLISSLCLSLGLSAFAHNGLSHKPKKSSTKAVEQSYIDAKYEIEIAGEHNGHFFIRKAKKNALLIDQYFHVTENVTGKKITVRYGDNKILHYNVSDDEGIDPNTYTMIIDFQDLDGGDNAGVKISYSSDANGARTFVSEDVIVRLLELASEQDEDSNQHDHGGDTSGHDDHSGHH